jgi:hypothetical protein
LNESACFTSSDGDYAERGDTFGIVERLPDEWDSTDPISIMTKLNLALDFYLLKKNVLHY